jgi:DNA polymerase III subunit delta
VVRLAARDRLGWLADPPRDRSPALLHVLYGDDEFRASEALRTLKASLDSDGSLATNITVLAGRNLTPAELIQHAAAHPFLAPARLVVIEGLLTVLGSRRGVVETWQPLLDFLPQMPETNHVVLLEPPPRRDDRGGGIGRSPLLAALRQQPSVTVTEFPELKTWSRSGPSEVAQWLQARAVQQGISIEPAALQALGELTGANLRMLATELEKLAMYAHGRTVTAEDVRLLTPESKEESIFALVDAIVEGRAAIALRLLRRMLTEGAETPAHVQILVARQLRLLVRATEILERRGSQDDVAQATGQRGFPLTKLMRQSRATSRASTEAGLRAIESADFAVKRGRLPDELALELLVVRLADLAPRAATARR